MRRAGLSDVCHSQNKQVVAPMHRINSLIAYSNFAETWRRFNSLPAIAVLDNRVLIHSGSRNSDLPDALECLALIGMPIDV